MSAPRFIVSWNVLLCLVPARAPMHVSGFISTCVQSHWIPHPNKPWAAGTCLSPSCGNPVGVRQSGERPGDRPHSYGSVCTETGRRPPGSPPEAINDPETKGKAAFTPKFLDWSKVHITDNHVKWWTIITRPNNERFISQKIKLFMLFLQVKPVY